MNPTITHLRELLSKATPGTWRIFDNGDYYGIEDARDGSRVVQIYKYENDANWSSENELIVAAVNALPALLDRLEKLERRRLLSMPHTHLTGADCSRCDEADELDEELDQ